jgi:TPR repeat protein
VAVNKKESLKWYSVAAERVDLQAQDRLLETMRRLSSELASA